MGQHPAQISCFLKTRVRGQPFIRHGDQEIQVGIGPLGAVGTREPKRRTSAPGMAAWISVAIAGYSGLIHHVGRAGGAGGGGHDAAP